MKYMGLGERKGDFERMKWLYFIHSDDVKGEKNRLLKNYLARKKIHYTILLLDDE